MRSRASTGRSSDSASSRRPATPCGYNHQLTGNAWNSRDAAVRTEGATGLAEAGLLADGETLAAARFRCRDSGVSLVADGETLVVRDPWGTQLRLKPEPAR